MSSKRKPEVGQGQTFSWDTQRITRSSAARKAAISRRDEQAGREVESRRHKSLVTYGTDVETCFGLISKGFGDQADANEPTKHVTTDDVIADLVHRSASQAKTSRCGARKNL